MYGSHILVRRTVLRHKAIQQDHNTDGSTHERGHVRIRPTWSDDEHCRLGRLVVTTRTPPPGTRAKRGRGYYRRRIFSSSPVDSIYISRGGVSRTKRMGNPRAKAMHLQCQERERIHYEERERRSDAGENARTFAKAALEQHPRPVCRESEPLAITSRSEPYTSPVSTGRLTSTSATT